MKEELEKIKKMKFFEYFYILNIKIKEKLIRLCLDRKVLRRMKDSTNYKED